MDLFRQSSLGQFQPLLSVVQSSSKTPNRNLQNQLDPKETMMLCQSSTKTSRSIWKPTEDFYCSSLYKAWQVNNSISEVQWRSEKETNTKGSSIVCWVILILFPNITCPIKCSSKKNHMPFQQLPEKQHMSDFSKTSPHKTPSRKTLYHTTLSQTKPEILSLPVPS